MTKGLENNPSYDTTQSLNLSGFQKTLPQLSEEKQARLEDILNIFREQVAVRRVLVKPYFKDYDQVISCHTVGHVTKAQFRQGLTMLFSPYVKLQDEDYKVCTRLVKGISRIIKNRSSKRGTPTPAITWTMLLLLKM